MEFRRVLCRSVAEIMIKRRLLRADGIGELVERSFMKDMVAKEARGGAQHLQPLCLAPDILADPGGRPILHRTHRTALRSVPPGRLSSMPAASAKMRQRSSK